MVNWKNSAHLKMNEAGYALVDTLNKCSTIWKQISNHLTQQTPQQHSYCEETQPWVYEEIICIFDTQAELLVC